MTLWHFLDLSRINIGMSLIGSNPEVGNTQVFCSIPFIHDDIEFSWVVNGVKVIELIFILNIVLLMMNTIFSSPKYLISFR